MSAATLAHTGIQAALVPQDLLDEQVHQRACDALQTVGMALSLADMQLATLKDVRRNGGLSGACLNLRLQARAARDLAEALETLAATNGGPAR